MKTLKTPIGIFVFSFVLAFALVQRVSANLVTDPNFTEISTPAGLTSATSANTSGTLYGEFGTGNLTGTNTYLQVAGWSGTGYNYVYTYVGGTSTATAGTKAGGANAGMPAQQPGQYANTYMWGPNSGGAGLGPANGFTATPPGPKGSNFVAMDGAANLAGAISQTINGLVNGQKYFLSFFWGAAQQESFSGPTSDSMTVSLGGSSFTTGTVALASEGFSGWMEQTVYFTATGTSEVLSFLANGTPNGEPPFALLSDIDMEVVPDFSNWMVFAVFGLACILFEIVRRRLRRPAAASATSTNAPATEPFSGIVQGGPV